MKGLRCDGCDKVIALTDSKFLYVGGIALPFRATFLCLHCGRNNMWRPVIELNGRNGITMDSPLSIDALAEMVGK